MEKKARGEIEEAAERERGKGGGARGGGAVALVRMW